MIVSLKPGTKKSIFSADISPKNRFSAGTEKKKQRKNQGKINKIADFSPKNRKISIFPTKKCDCGALTLVLEFLKKYQ